MNAAATDPTKPHLTEVRGILSQRKEDTQKMASLFEEVAHPKATFQNNDIYAVHTSEDEYLYEEPEEKESQEEREPREKNMRVFYKLNVKDDVYFNQYPFMKKNIQMRILNQ